MKNNLNKQTIKDLSRLSRIHCSAEEENALLNDLQNILNYMEQLQDVDTDHVKPCYHVLEDIVNVMREDKIGPTLSRDTFLENSPSHVGGMIRVPTVLKQHSSTKQHHTEGES